jgi:hypothetical protein
MKRLAIFITAGLIATMSFSIAAHAAVKSGATCPKLAATSTLAGYKYTCIKSGKKLIWSKGVKVAVAKPSPTPTTTPSATTPTAVGDPIGAIGSTPTPTATPSLPSAADKAAAEKLAADQAAAAKSAAEKAAAHRATLTPCPANGKCVVGNIGPAGGIIFYVASTPQSWGQYLEVAPASWAGSYVDPYTQWCALGDSLLVSIISDPEAKNRNSEKIGTGKSNTDFMLSTCINGIANSVHNYRGGGKSDWYLPSSDELKAMLKAADSIADFSVSSYWSSSLAPVYGAWDQVIFGGTNYTSDETNAGSVRPVRAFG